MCGVACAPDRRPFGHLHRAKYTGICTVVLVATVAQEFAPLAGNLGLGLGHVALTSHTLLQATLLQPFAAACYFTTLQAIWAKAVL